ncbi:MAG TPA: S8 family serine peptidase [Streptosporangiaceae bacterium]
MTRGLTLALAAGLVTANVAMAAAPAAASTVRSREWWLQTLHVTKAWMSTHGAGVTVAVLDTGVDPNQADLTGSVITGPDYTGSQRAAGGPYWGIHGTAMASLIAGHGHGTGQAGGIMGIAPDAKILSVRVTLESNDPMLADANVAAGLPDAIAHGIRYAVRHGAKVIDLPLDPVTSAGAPGSGGSPAEKAAVADALAHQVVLVAPAGDNLTPGTNPVNYPAAYPGVISVGAFDSSFMKATFSSARPYVTLTAAGVGVVAASQPAGYAPISSTSAASAVVAGIVALIRAQFPSFTPAQVTKALTTSTIYRRRNGQATGSGAGTVDAAAALAAAASINAAVTPSPSPPGQTQAAPAPSAPAVHSTGSSLSKSLITDAYLAGAVFLLLVLGIFGFRLLRRRRARAARLAEVRAAAQPPNRKARKPGATAGARRDGSVPSPLSPGLPTTTSSLPAEAPLPAGAASFPAGAAAGSRGRHSSGDSFPGGGFTGSSFSGSAGPASPRAIPGSAFPRGQYQGLVAEPAGPGGSEAGDFGFGAGFGGPGADRGGPGGGWGDPSDTDAGGFGADVGGGRGSGGTAAGSVTPGPAARVIGSHRLGGPRLPKITGRPPWEPAPEPSGEVPWALPTAGATPLGLSQPRGPVEMPLPAPPEPDQSPWDAAAQEAWPGGPAASRPVTPVGGPPDLAHEWADGPGQLEPGGASEADGGSLYVWNPGESTESFPIIPPGERKRP